MSAFGKIVRGRCKVRCDGCGIISSSVDGEYVLDRKTGRIGYINNHGRDCEHDLCEACEERQAPTYACPKCGTRPES